MTEYPAQKYDTCRRDLMHQVTIEQDKCKGCGYCIIWCPLKHLEFSSALNKRGVHYAKRKEKVACSGCGICYLVCPDYCIEVHEDDSSSKKVRRKNKK